MNNFIITLVILFSFLLSNSSAIGQNSYMVNRIYSDNSIDADWGKECWKKAKVIHIKNPKSG